MTIYDATQHAEALSHFDRHDSNAKTYARVFNRLLQKGSLALMGHQKRYDPWAAGAHAGTFRGKQIAMVAGAALSA